VLAAREGVEGAAAGAGAGCGSDIRLFIVGVCLYRLMITSTLIREMVGWLCDMKQDLI
jgi:hypothetical protein